MRSKDMSLRKHIGRNVAAAGTVVCGPVNSPGRAQSPAATKPSRGGGPFYFGFEPGGRFVAENVTLRFVLEHAYGLRDFQISGGPAWIDAEHCDIEAKPDGPEERQAQRWLMVQARLADRFKLTLHRETKELPAYALAVAKDLTMNGYGLDRLAEFTLKWTPDESQGHMVGGPPGDAAPPAGASGPSIFTALQEQLGLKLESQKGPVDTTVIDRVERPSEN